MHRIAAFRQNVACPLGPGWKAQYPHVVLNTVAICPDLPKRQAGSEPVA